VPRFLTIAAAQSGPVSRQTPRGEVVARLVEQMREARARGCDLIVFTECALTAFFPHWWIEGDLSFCQERPPLRVVGLTGKQAG
jgi:N-carbamoyl-D-amino-acid hydrolase